MNAVKLAVAAASARVFEEVVRVIPSICRGRYILLRERRRLTQPLHWYPARNAWCLCRRLKCEVVWRYSQEPASCIGG